MERNELANRWFGMNAKNYYTTRSEKPKWRREQVAMDGMLQSLLPKSSIIDVPVGTGRFLEFYQKRNLHVTGVDISEDMLAESRKRAAELGLDAKLSRGSIFELAFPANSFDCALCVRLLNWLSAADVVIAMAELSRVSRKYVIVGVRTYAENQHALDRLLAWIEPLAGRLFSRKQNDGRTSVHRKADVIAAFKLAKLEILKSQRIRFGPRETRYDYYLLSKAGA